MPDIPPLRLIAATQEREPFARMLETFGHAVVTRVLPALQFNADELLEISSVAAPAYDVAIPPESNVDAFSSFEPGGPPSDNIWFAQMEMGVVRFYALGFAFVAIYHLFERQLATVIGWLNHRHKGAVLGDLFRSKQLRFTDLKKILRQGKVPIDAHFSRELERLRLITNVVKHSSRDLAVIAHDHRDLLPGWQPGNQLTPDLVALNPELLRSFVTTLAGFWRTFPQE